MTWIGHSPPTLDMRPLLLAALAALCLAEDVDNRPMAIIPWSQYQQRLKASRMKQIPAAESQENLARHEYYVKTNPNDLSRNYMERPPLGDQMPPRPQFNSEMRPPVTPRPRSRNPVIRPQLRNRGVTEPSDYAREHQMKIAQQKILLQKEKERTHMGYPPAPNIMPHKQPSMARQPIQAAATDVRSLQRKIPASPSFQERLTDIQNIRIPNGVPYHAGTWEDGQPHYVPEPRPAQRGASSITGLDPSIPLASLNQAAAAGQPIGGGDAGNIVNSIFAQSRAQGVPIQAVANAQPNAVESFLSNSGNLDTISKLAKNLLNVGGDTGQSSGGGGLLDVMANALRGTRLPMSSAHDEYPPTIEAHKPQSSLFEKLIGQAATTINQMKKETKPEVPLFPAPSKEPEVAKKEPERQVKLSKSKEDSLKLLEGLPKEQREILEAAIISKEIDADTLGPAIGALVKEDTKEESKKEKESRLLEWIRENRPSKAPEVKVTADKLPYYGKYCGSLPEPDITKKRFKPSGAIWAVDERRLIVSKFYFEAGSLLNENVTFWLGPKTPTENKLIDQFPSENGFYIHPIPIDVSVFTLEELLPVIAKHRKNIDAKVFLNGTEPIKPVKDFKTPEPLRSRRQVTHVLRDEQPPTYAPAAKKPVELLVKGGVVQVMPDNHEQMNSTFAIDKFERNIQTAIDEAKLLSNSNSIITPAAKVRQPEYDKIDYNIPQPLEWYAGFQPLLLTLPEGRSMSDIQWVALRDHKRQDTIASVMLPNGPGFVIPSTATIRPLSPNGLFNITTGNIFIRDMKSIEITNFTLRTDGEPVWFMMGRDILPNPTGSIIPIYDTKHGLFDCESLRDYYGETVHLRIPGHMDMRDIFWFSVYNPVKSVSLSHIYLPYDHLRLPPDLTGTPTATCNLKT